MSNSNKNNKKGYEIATDNGSFQIYFGSDYNLYWVPCVKQEDLSKTSFEYTISDDDVFLCKLFDQLYDSVIKQKPFVHEEQGVLYKSLDELEHDLVKDGKIEWHSDDFAYDAGSTFVIERDDKANYHITFNRSKNSSDYISAFYTFAVQIKLVGSRYGAYAEPFVEMYGDLQKNEEFPNNILYAVGLNGKKRVRTR